MRSLARSKLRPFGKSASRANTYTPSSDWRGSETFSFFSNSLNAKEFAPWT
jgi:hypothetical protein